MTEFGGNLKKQTEEPELHDYSEHDETVAEISQKPIKKTASISFTISGEDVDKIDWYEWLRDVQQESKFCIERGVVNIGYSEWIEKTIDLKDNSDRNYLFKK
jgi:hypothetical protein